LDFLKVFYTWQVKKKRNNENKSHVSATYAHLVSWREEGCFPDIIFKRIQIRPKIL